MKVLIFFLIIIISKSVVSAGSSSEKMPRHQWSFNGITGTFDQAAIQRGYKVYREVCEGCHSMKLLYYRDLIDIGFSEVEVKAIASEYTVLDGPNDDGEMFERSARPSDRFVPSYANENEARISNNGAYPPDLTVITKAKKYGEDYIYNLLMGYEDPPEDFEVGDGMYYNKWMDGNQIAMPQPIYEGSVDYDDGTDNNAKQLTRDVVTFLKWSAEPELEIRKNLGIKVMLFFLVLGTIVYLVKNSMWRKIS